MRPPAGWLRVVEPLVARQGIDVGEDDVAVGTGDHGLAVVALADMLAAVNGVEAAPGAHEAVAFVLAVDHFRQAQAFELGGRWRQRKVGQPEQGDGLADGAPADLGRGRVVVLAAFERDAVAAFGAHVLGGADAVARVGVIQQAACAAPCA